MGKITVSDGPSSNTPYWDDPEAAEVPAELEPAPKPTPKRAAKPVPEG